MRLLVLGLGYSATRFVELHGDRFEAVAATVRCPDERAPVEGVELLCFDGAASHPALDAAVAGATHLLVSIPPDADGDPALRVLGGAIEAAPALAWIGYLSTIGVYGDHAGAWIDEGAPPEPREARAHRRIEVEAAWTALGTRRGIPVQLFRLAGIYGPGRSPLDKLLEGRARRIVKPGQVFNRIHVDDIAGAVLAGLDHPGIGPLVNVADDEPAPPQDVLAYAAGLLGVEPPPEVPFETAEMTPMARSFYAGNRRVSNHRLRRELGLELAYPTYREGLRACLAR